MKYIVVVAISILLTVPAFAAESDGTQSQPAARKIAMASKRLKKAPVTSVQVSPEKQLLASLPVEAQDAIQNFGKVANKVGRGAKGKLDEVAGWLGKLYRQCTEMPRATPTASPYVSVPKVFGDGVARNVYTGEGRIKTCVHR